MSTEAPPSDTSTGRPDSPDGQYGYSDGPHLTRSRTNRRVAGVCGGIGEHFGIEPWLIRAAVVALTIAGGSGVPLYAAAWLLIPDHGDERSMAADLLRGRDLRPRLERRDHRAVLAVVLAVVVLGGLGEHHLLAGASLGLAVVVGLAVLGFFPTRSSRGDGRPDGPLEGPSNGPPDSEGKEDSDSKEDSEDADDLLALAAAYRANPWVGLGSYEVGSLDHEPSLAPGSVNRGSRHGRRAVAWIGVAIVGAAVLSLLLLAVAASSIGVSGGIGQRTYRPTTAAEIRPDYRVGVGELVVDLRAVTAASLAERTGGAALSIAGRVGTGHLVVLLPPGVRTHVITHAGTGEVAIGADTTSGAGVDRELTVEPPAQASSAPVIDLALGIGVGRIEVRPAE